MAGARKCLAKGAVAGAMGVWLMDRFTWYWYSNENSRALVKERKAQKGGRYAPNAAGKYLTDALEIKLPQRQQFIIGRSIHYLMGIVPGAFYALWRHKMKFLPFLRGPAYGAGLFITFDEILTLAAGFASGPLSYPWQAHARGFFAHLILGIATEAVLSLIDDAA